jgi:hypothetical protein
MLLSGPRHQQSHKHPLDGWDTPVNGRFDQKAKVGSTWIDGPTLNRHNFHQGVILDVPQHGRCITRPLSRVGHTYQLVCRAKPSQGADLQPPQEQWSGSSKFICGGSQSRPHLEIRSHLLVQHRSSLSPTSTPSCSHRPIGAIYRAWHLVEGHKWLESKWRSPT